VHHAVADNAGVVGARRQPRGTVGELVVEDGALRSTRILPVT